MKISVKLLAQARALAGRDSDTIECAETATVTDVLHVLVEKYGDALSRLLLDEHGKPHASVMLFVNDEQTFTEAPQRLSDRDEVTIMPPISGG